MANSTTSNAPTSTTGSAGHSIRNISQTAQEREIIKSCPDIIVYLNGKAYLINPYINSTTQSGKNNTPTEYAYVNFNDHVQTFQTSYDVDSLVPNGSISLQVPNHMKYLYQSPGGNNLLETMMEVQVYAKGWFPSGTGNTVYYRVFKGLTTNVSHVDNGTVLQITVQIQGILHFLDFMFLDLNPAALTNSPRGMTPFSTNQANMNPYEQLAAVFNQAITVEGFQRVAIIQNDEPGWQDAVGAGYINKWQTILDNVRREVHITGYRMGADKDLPVPNTADNGAPQNNKEANGSQDPTFMASRFTVNPAISRIDKNPDYYVNIIRQYLPDLGIGNLQLTNGKITSILERIRTIVQLIGYEGYQDVDGTVIFKPPLYNLDVTNIGAPISSSSGGAIPTSVDIRTDTNPFIVHLSEIESESESEDEQAVRATRITVSTPFLPNSLISSDATTQIRPTISHIDIPRLAKFGLREEAARPIPWLGWNDKIAAYAYGVSELNRANRGWRTYTLTIPLRPELKLGFPMYLPHKDMYGYIKSISVSYQQGGAATMTVVLDSLRKRPVFPAKHTITLPDKTTTQIDIYTTQPNLVMKWTEAPSASSNTSSTGNAPAAATQTTNRKAATSTATGGASSDSSAVKLDNPATLPRPKADPIYLEDLEVINNRANLYGTSWQTKSDSKGKSFRVQKDEADSTDGVPVGQPFFSATNWLNNSLDPEAESTANSIVNGQQVAPTTPQKNKGINVTYLQKVLNCQPYTDEGGYELLTPFPWGRWKTLKEALLETRLGMASDNPVDSLNSQTISGTDVFLFAGVGSPSSIDPSSSLTSELNKLNNLSSLTGANTNLSNFAPSSTSFELIMPAPGTPQNKNLTDTQPDSQLLSQVDETTARTDFFVTGGDAPCTDYQQIYRQVTPPTNSTTIPNAVGVTPSANQQSQTFVSKLLNKDQST